MSTTPLPPTPRDFDIHRMSLVYHMSTRQIAEKHGISQTRVRQVIQRVCQWLAATIRVRTGVEKEKEAELAQHLAAEQMRYQIEQLQNYWDGSGDPKYLRQQTRIIAALARLGTIPGTIEGLVADVTTGPLDPNEPQSPWSEDDPWANKVVPSLRKGHEPPSTIHTRNCVTTAGSASSGSPVADGVSDLHCPPPGDCSAAGTNLPAEAATNSNGYGATSTRPTPSNRESREDESTLGGLKMMEGRLLALIDGTSSADSDRRASLSDTLAQVRQLKATYELRLSPSIPGGGIRVERGSPQKDEPEEAERMETSKC